MLKVQELLGIADLMNKRPITGLIITLLLAIISLGAMYVSEHRRAERKEREIVALNAKLIDLAERSARAIEAVNEKRIEEIKHLSGIGQFAERQSARMQAIEDKIKKIK